MNAKRAGAVVAAAVMIVAAWFVRDRVLDDGDAGPTSSTGEVVCVRDLEFVCNAVGDALDVDVRIESVDATLTAWGEAEEIPNEVWITMAPFPEMADSLRGLDSLAPTDSTVETVASSPLTLVVNADIADELTVTCGDPVDWRCLGADSTDVTIGFSPFPSTATGQLGVTTAVLGFGNGSIPPNDADFTVWARQIAGKSDNQSSATTAVATIQIRPSSFDLAVGAAAELTDANASRFVLLTPSETTSIDVVVAMPVGITAPAGLTKALGDELTNAGWTRTQTASAAVSSNDMLTVREIWKLYL